MTAEAVSAFDPCYRIRAGYFCKPTYTSRASSSIFNTEVFSASRVPIPIRLSRL